MDTENLNGGHGPSEEPGRHAEAIPGLTFHPEFDGEEEGPEVKQPATVSGDEGENASKDKKEDPDKFSLGESEPEVQADGTGKEEDGDLFPLPILRDGVALQVTNKKAQALIQKGLDYDVKMGPHVKLAQLVEADPEIARAVQEVVNRRLQNLPLTFADGEAPKPKKFKPPVLEDYDNATEWGAALIEAYEEYRQGQEQEKPKKQLRLPDEAQKVDHKSIVRGVVRDYGRSLEDFDLVYDALGEYAKGLSVGDMQKIDHDPTAFCKFFDWVKERVVKGKTKPQNKIEPPPFRAKSRGGEPATPENDPAYAWNLSREKFDELINKVKGFD